jgi:hypothetical protein
MLSCEPSGLSLLAPAMPRKPRPGGNCGEGGGNMAAFAQGLKEAGYVERQNVAVEYRMGGRSRPIFDPIDSCHEPGMRVLARRRMTCIVSKPITNCIPNSLKVFP